MYNVTKVSKRNTKIMGRSDIGIDDGDSERSMLSEAGAKMEGGIMKTVVHEVRSEERMGSGSGGSREVDSFEHGR